MRHSFARGLVLALPVAFLCGVGMAPAALAAAAGEVSVGAINNTSCPLTSTNPNCAIGTTSASVDNAGLSSAGAQASLASGTLSIQASSDGTFGHYAAALAEIWDSFAFSGVTAGQTATVTISGTASATGSAALNYFADLVPAGLISPPNGGNGELIPLGTTGAWSVTTQFAIANGALDNGAYTFNAGLSGATSLCGSSDCPGVLAMDAVVTLTVPDNVTVTFDTGLGTAVPEPATWVLFLFAPALFWLRRRVPVPNGAR